MDTPARIDPDFAPAPIKRARAPFFRWHEIRIILLIDALLVVLVLTWLHRRQEASLRSSQCPNNLRQIGLALHLYEQEYGCLPPAATVDANGRVLHSWRTLILPFCEQGELYASIDLTKPWDDPANARARATIVGSFHCPDSTDPANTTTYLALRGPDACFADHAGRPLAAITDGHGSTLSVVEAGPADAVPWMQPSDADAAGLARIVSAQSHHPGRVRVLLADGSVRTLTQETPAADSEAMRTIAGGEPPPPDRD